MIDTVGRLLASCVVAASCDCGITVVKVWGTLTLHHELLDHEQTVFVDGSFGRRCRQYLARRGIQAQVPTGVLARKGPFFIQAKQWVVEGSLAWAGNDRRLAKDYERKTQRANAWLHVADLRRLARLI